MCSSIDIVSKEKSTSNKKSNKKSSTTATACKASVRLDRLTIIPPSTISKESPIVFKDTKKSSSKRHRRPNDSDNNPINQENKKSKTTVTSRRDVYCIYCKRLIKSRFVGHLKKYHSNETHVKLIIEETNYYNLRQRVSRFRNLGNNYEATLTGRIVVSANTLKELHLLQVCSGCHGRYANLSKHVKNCLFMQEKVEEDEEEEEDEDEEEDEEEEEDE